MRVIMAEAAEYDLASALLYIAADDQEAALRLVSKLEAAGNSLTNFPRRGRPGRVVGTREWVVPGTKYILIYDIDGERVEILHVLHGAREWPPRSG